MVSTWNVAVTVELSDDHPEPSSAMVQALEASLPGGGFATSFEHRDYYATRVFTKTLTVGADDAGQAEQIARETMDEAIDPALYPGWAATGTGEARPVDSIG